MHISQILLQIGIILVLGRVLARGLRRLGQPSVIAEIVAGIALGPSLLGLVSPAAMAWVFPPDSLPGLGLVAQLGLVFFMFLVGLEFDPRLLQGQARASIAISLAGMLVPFGMGMGLALPLHAPLAPEGVGLLPFSLFLGVAMCVTAFPVLARILTERRLIRTQVGALALAAAAFGDVTAWCALALVVGIAGAGGLASAILTTILALAYSALVWLVVRPILARLGPREGQRVSTESIGVVFLLLLASAAATEWIGIHALFGAFLIGASMPREGGLTEVLTEKTEDFVTIVLLPLFFAYSGLRTQIGLLSTPQDWALAAAIIAVSCIGKYGGTALAGRWTGLRWRDASALGVLMNTRGLMELVILNVGLDLGVISERLFAMMVLMALVTTWMTSPLLQRIYPSAPPPALPAHAPRGLLLCVSDPATAPSLVQLARAWAQHPVWALHLRPTDRPQDYLRPEDTCDAEPLDAIARAAFDAGISYEALSFPSATPAEDICRVAADKHPSLVVVGVHRSSLGWDSLGGVAGRVLKDCPSAVAVLVDRGVGRLERVRVASDTPEVRALAALLQRAGAALVEDGPADLVLRAYQPGLEIPQEAGPSWLLLRPAAT